MSTAPLLNTCQVCGAEESLDALLLRMIDDDQVRRLIAEVLTNSLPLGGLVVRYLRLHKPPRQRLRLATVSKLLAELVPDIQRTAIERKGRVWAVSGDSWKAALQVVFDAADKGTLALPLEGNGYLYGVLVRMADRDEGGAERDAEQRLRQRVHESAPTSASEAAKLSVASAAALPEPSDPEAVAKAAAIRAALRQALDEKRKRTQEPEVQP